MMDMQTEMKCKKYKLSTTSAPLVSSVETVTIRYADACNDNKNFA